jgi:hypothetical protein
MGFGVRVASAKNRSPWAWGIAAVLVGFFALAVVALMPKAEVV